jgi:5-methylcytosine-specific restriction endonuclease McrA
MKFERESWRKLYVAESAQHRLLPIFTRGLRDYLLRLASDDGTLLPETEDAERDLVRLLNAEPSERKLIQAAYKQLLKIGYLSTANGRVWITKFEEAQEARSPEARRQAAWREAHGKGPKEPSPKTDFGSIRRLRQLDGDGCSYCGTELDFRVGRSLIKATLDHVVPRSQGGSDGEDNLVLACWSCNSKKGPRTPEAAGMALLNERVSALRVDVTNNAPGNVGIDETRRDETTATTAVVGDIPCPRDLKLTDDQRQTLETAMIPGWAIEALTADFVASNLAGSEPRSLVAWRKCLSKAICGSWNDPRKRPRKVAPETNADETGGYGAVSEWG